MAESDKSFCKNSAPFLTRKNHKPAQRDFIETIKTLAGLSRFVIADITKPRSSPLELGAIVPDYMSGKLLAGSLGASSQLLTIKDTGVFVS